MAPTSLSKIFLLLLPLPLSSSSTTSMPLPEVLLVGVRPGSTLQPGSTHLLTCSLPSITSSSVSDQRQQPSSTSTSITSMTSSPSVFDHRQPSSTSTSINQLNFTWSVDSRLHWVDPSPLHTESHSASSWEYVPQTGTYIYHPISRIIFGIFIQFEDVIGCIGENCFLSR